MKKTIRLSHSALQKYQECGKAYEYYYIDKLRPVSKSAALFFGTAVEAGFNAMLEGNADTANEIFDATWTWQGKDPDARIYLPTNLEITYANADFDPELLTEEDWDSYSQIYNIEEPDKYVDDLYDLKEKVGYDQLTGDVRKHFNHLNWLCLRRKGLIMLEGLRSQILPKIKYVHKLQQYVELSNQEGDKIVGFADLVCDWEGYDKPVILDLKTSAKEYEADSVLTSHQLSIYTYALWEQYQTNYAGYIVVNKNIIKNKSKVCKKCGYDGSGKQHKTCDNLVNGKRCHGEWEVTLNPKAYIQTIINAIPDRAQSIILENADQINNAIQNKQFHRNFHSCHTKWGGLCPYYHKCYYDKEDGLEYEVDSKKKN